VISLTLTIAQLDRILEGDAVLIRTSTPNGPDDIKIALETNPHLTCVLWGFNSEKIAYTNRDSATPTDREPWRWIVNVGHGNYHGAKATVGEAIERVEELLQRIHGMRCKGDGEFRICERIEGWKMDRALLDELKERGLDGPNPGGA